MTIFKPKILFSICLALFIGLSLTGLYFSHKQPQNNNLDRSALYSGPANDYKTGNNEKLIKGNKIVSLTDQTNITTIIPADWPLTASIKEDADVEYQIWHPPHLELTLQDRGNIELLNKDELVLSINTIFHKKNYPVTSLKNFFLQTLAPSQINNIQDREPAFNETDFSFAQLNFTNQKKYLLIKYHHYLVFADQPEDEQFTFWGYDPAYSAYNNINYYLGDLNNGLMIEVYDYQKIPNEEVLIILEHLTINPLTPI